MTGPVGTNLSEPGQFYDDNNAELMLTTTSLALLKSMLNAAVRRTNQRQEAGKVADSPGFSQEPGPRLRWPDVWQTAKEGDPRARNRRRSATQVSTQSGRSAVRRKPERSRRQPRATCAARMRTRSGTESGSARIRRWWLRGTCLQV